MKSESKIFLQFFLIVGMTFLATPLWASDPKNKNTTDWYINKNLPDFETTITSSIDYIKIQFSDTEDIKAINYSISILRKFPVFDLGVSPLGSVSASKIAALSTAQQHCVGLGLDDDCSATVSLDPYDVSPGDTVVLKVDVSLKENESFTKTGTFVRLNSGEFRIGIGALFVLSGSDDFITRADGDVFEVKRVPGDDLSLNMAATVTWVPTLTNQNPDWDLGPTIGVGVDDDDFSVFLGYSAIFKRAWTITGGVAAVKENKLNPMYRVGQVVSEPIDSSALMEDAYKARVFIGLTWAPKLGD